MSSFEGSRSRRRRSGLFCCCCGAAHDQSGAYAALQDTSDGRGGQQARRHDSVGSYQPPQVSAGSSGGGGAGKKGMKGAGSGHLNTSSSSVVSRQSSAVSVPVPTLKDFKLLKCIGKGGFSKVLQVQHRDTHVVYALKAVSKAMLKSGKEEERLLAEAQILRRISHPFLITLQFSFQTQRELLYVFDFVPGGVLDHHLKQSRFFNEGRARFYIGELILALEYLHGLGIIYRDLKLENCLIAHDGHLRLTDFGAAKDLMGDSKTTTFCGTPCYIAPEILRGEQYDQSVDWWTTGVILYEMLVGKPPFTGTNRHSLYKNVLKAPIALPERLSLAAKDILMQLLQRNPLSRLGGHMIARGDSASVLKAHDFFYLSKTISPSTTSSPAGTPVSSSLPDRLPSQEVAPARHPGTTGGEPTIPEDDILEESSVFDGVRRPTPGGGSAAINISVRDDGGGEADGRGRKSSRNRLMCHEPNTWTWLELERKKVEAPWKPRLVSRNDTTYFDPILTSEPPSLSDLPGSRGASVRKDLIKIDDFDFARERIG
ncbi:serine/threonine-protein kinase Sgk1-like [Sycon ciliatum]|uniref:serine/threonine-protein kinase Sgk1-like n=1 Tax=Sycon ciliatum TaxID=27933 RepID=UPI0031F66912